MITLARKLSKTTLKTAPFSGVLFMQKIKQFFVSSFFTYLAIELVEEALEELIVYGLSNLIIKGISTLFVVTLTQAVKVFIKTTIKKLTYTGGNDKVKFLKKIFDNIFANKKTILGTLGNTLSSCAAIFALYSTDIANLPIINIGELNITPIVAGVLLFFGVEMGLIDKGLESVKEFNDRKTKEKAEKIAKNNIKQAKKEIAEEKRLANQTQAEQEKAQAKAEKEAKEKADKEAKEQAMRAEIEKIKAELKAQEQSK